jgi:hypothetical protein
LYLTPGTIYTSTAMAFLHRWIVGRGDIGAWQLDESVRFNQVRADRELRAFPVRLTFVDCDFRRCRAIAPVGIRGSVGVTIEGSGPIVRASLNARSTRVIFLAVGWSPLFMVFTVSLLIRVGSETGIIAGNQNGCSTTLRAEAGDRFHNKQPA